MSKIKVYIDFTDYAGEARIYVVDGTFAEPGKIYVLKSFDDPVFEAKDDGDIIEPTLQLNRRFCGPFFQAMADALHKAGVRPEGEPVLQNELTAVKYHLEDMRALVFQAPTVIKESTDRQ